MQKIVQLLVNSADQGRQLVGTFNSVLNGILRLHETLLRQPDPVPENCTDDRWKMFKVCLYISLSL